MEKGDSVKAGAIAITVIAVVALAVAIVAMVLGTMAFVQSSTQSRAAVDMSGPIAATTYVLKATKTPNGIVTLSLPEFDIASAAATGALVSTALPVELRPKAISSFFVQGTSTGTKANYVWTIALDGTMDLRFDNDAVFGSGNAYTVTAIAVSYEA